MHKQSPFVVSMSVVDECIKQVAVAFPSERPGLHTKVSRPDYHQIPSGMYQGLNAAIEGYLEQIRVGFQSTHAL